MTLPPKRLREYAPLVNKKVIGDIEALGSLLRGRRIVEVNSTAEGGGVSEILKSYIPLLRDLGIESSWRVLMPDTKFFKITKTIHNCLQGICPLPPTDDLKYYNEYLQRQAKFLPDADLYVLHDPQTLGLIDHLGGKPVIWRCHIDLTSSEHKTLEWIRGYYQKFSAVIFSLDNYALGLDKSKIAIIEPAIDPFNDKNRLLTAAHIHRILSEFNLDPKHPFITQISRFDSFKNPIGVLDMFAHLKKELPDLHCVLMGNYATDDPEGYPYFQQLRAKIHDLKLPGIRLITKNDNSLVNALQTAAAAVIQNSSREGFGLTVTEAMWKGNIVFARPVGGIALQIINRKTGFYLFDDVHENADLIAKVIRDPEKYADVRRDAKRHVKDNFLMTRMLHDQMVVYKKALGLD